MDEDFKYIPDESVGPAIPKSTRFTKKRVLVLFVCIFVLSIIFYNQYLRSPANFPNSTMIIVDKGETLSGVSNTLFQKNVIRSQFFFKVFLTLFGGTKGLVAGDYMLGTNNNLISISWKFSRGIYDLKNIRITIPEGKNVKEIAKIFDTNLYNFDDKKFLRLASTSEGYLFPDTYLFQQNSDATEVFNVLRKTFDEKIQSIDADIMLFKKSGFAKLKKITTSDIIKMASILEEEGRTAETRQVIAGILWKRLSIGMALQLDATVVYATGKSDGSLLTQDDFKIDSPYNTYLNRGFPPTPISNPGLEAIKAAINPTASKYFYYITDKKGGFYPAVTYDEQLSNEAKYLSN